MATDAQIRNDSPCQRDKFCPKIVEIEAIVGANFRPFELFSEKFWLPWAANRVNKDMKQLNPQLHIIYGNIQEIFESNRNSLRAFLPHHLFQPTSQRCVAFLLSPY